MSMPRHWSSLDGNIRSGWSVRSNQAAWQARTPTGITAAQLAIAWEGQQVTCLAGEVSRHRHPCTDSGSTAAMVVQFARADCLGCARRAECTQAKTNGRQSMLRPQEQHVTLQDARVAGHCGV
jgi:hypothetical protein